VVPAFNESGRVGPTLTRLLADLERRVESSQVVLVDDGSTDGTADRVERELGGRVDVVRCPVNRGKGAALRRGVEAARHPWVLFVDADLGVPIEELEHFLPRTDEAPILIGSKRVRGADNRQPAWRRFLGGLGQLLIRWFAVSGFRDTQCGFKLLRTDVARELLGAGRIDGFGYDFELLWLARRLGYAVLELPVRVEDSGSGTIRKRSYLMVLGDLLRFRWHRLLGRYPRRRSAA
jgi:dolichyl-phosphate beta-glucosyltransferase